MNRKRGKEGREKQQDFSHSNSYVSTVQGTFIDVTLNYYHKPQRKVLPPKYR